MGLWKQIRGLFAEAEASTKLNPVEHSVLTRHRDWADDLTTWRDGMIAGQLRQWLADNYALFLSDQPGRVDEALDFLDTPSSKGFVIHFSDTEYALREAELFQLYLRERVLAHAYRTQVADSRTYAFKGGTERTDRYYLKPRPNWSPPEGHAGGMDTYTADQFDQQFGNVLLELTVRNERPHQLKFSATVYHDRVYQQARGFGGLMDVVLGKRD